MAKDKKMAMGGLGGFMPAIKKITSQIAAKPPMSAPKQIAPPSMPVAPPSMAKPVAPPPVAKPAAPVAPAPTKSMMPPPQMINRMAQAFKGMRFSNGGKISTASKNKSSPNW